MGSAAAVDLFQLISTNRKFEWTDPYTDVASKIDLVASHPQNTRWLIQIKTRLNEPTLIADPDEYLRKTTSRKELIQIQEFQNAVRKLEPNSIPLLCVIQYNKENINMERGTISTNLFSRLRKQLESIIRQ